MRNTNIAKVELASNDFLSLIFSGIILAACYGSTFMLGDYFLAKNIDPTLAGNVISVGVIATIIAAVFAGRLAEKIGLNGSLATSSLLMALSMFSFSLLPFFGYAMYIGGILLGVSWAIFYILAPLIIIENVHSSERVKYLTYLSGSQMLGLGLSAPIGHQLAISGLVYEQTFIVLALASTMCALLFFRMKSQDKSSKEANSRRLSVAEAKSVLGRITIIPIAMIGLLACVFSALATFQSIYAQSRNVDPEYFFIVFTCVAVALRFGIAAKISKVPIYILAISLIVLIIFSMIGFTFFVLGFSNYVIATAVFAVGYGLSYSTLNSIVVNIAEEKSLSVTSSSQIFTLSYFVGIFGFPYIAGAMIRNFSIDSMYIVLLLISLSVLSLAILLRKIIC